MAAPTTDPPSLLLLRTISSLTPDALCDQRAFFESLVAQHRPLQHTGVPAYERWILLLNQILGVGKGIKATPVQLRCGAAFLVLTVRDISQEAFLAHHKRWSSALLSALKTNAKDDDQLSTALLALCCAAKKWPSCYSGPSGLLKSGAVKQYCELLVSQVSDSAEQSAGSLVSVSDRLRVLFGELGTAVRPQIDAVQEALTPLLDHTDETLRQSSANILAECVFARGASSWHSVAQKVLASLHKILDEYLPEEFTAHAKLAQRTEGMNLGRLPVGNDSSSISASSSQLASAISRRFSSLCFLLIGLVRGSSALNRHFVSVPVALFRDFFDKALSAHVSAARMSCFTGSSTLGGLSLHAILPQMQIQSLELLSAFSAMMGRRLLPQAQLLCQVFAKIAQRTAFDGEVTASFPLPDLREALYETVSEVALHCGGGLVSQVAGKTSLFREILRDVPLPRQFRISGQQNALANLETKSSSSGAQQQTRKPNRGDSVRQSFSRFADIDRVGLSAARTLTTLLSVGGSLLGSELRIGSDRTLVNILLSCADNSGRLLSTMPDDNRAALFEALEASLLAPMPTHSPLLPYAVRLFASGARDTSAQVRRVCQRAQLVANAITHPRQVARALVPKHDPNADQDQSANAHNESLDDLFDPFGSASRGALAPVNPVSSAVSSHKTRDPFQAASQHRQPSSFIAFSAPPPTQQVQPPNSQPTQPQESGASAMEVDSVAQPSVTSSQPVAAASAAVVLVTDQTSNQPPPPKATLQVVASTPVTSASVTNATTTTNVRKSLPQADNLTQEAQQPPVKKSKLEAIPTTTTNTTTTTTATQGSKSSGDEFLSLNVNDAPDQDDTTPLWSF